MEKQVDRKSFGDFKGDYLSEDEICPKANVLEDTEVICTVKEMIQFWLRKNQT